MSERKQYRKDFKPLDELIAPLVFSRYRQAGIIPGWKSDRLIKLAHLANRTPEELGAMAALTPGETRRMMKTGIFSPPVSLHFALIEHAVKSARFGEPGEAPMPLDLLK